MEALMANDFYSQQSSQNATQTKRRRFSKWHEEPLYTQLKKAVRAVRFEGKTVTQACLESLPCEGCTKQIPARTLSRHVAMSRDEPGTFLYMPPSEQESARRRKTFAHGAKRVCQRPMMTTQPNNCQPNNCPDNLMQSRDSTQPKKCGPSTWNSDFDAVSQANTWCDGTAAEHNNLDVSLENNIFGTPTKQEEFTWLDNLEQLDTSGWSDCESLCDQTNCTDSCSSNQEDQMNGCANDNMNLFTCSAQGDWGACSPTSISCAPGRMDCVVARPPPLCRDESCSSLLSNLSFVDSCNADCIESDMNADNFGDDARGFSRVCHVDDLLASPVLDAGFEDFESFSN